MDGDLGDDWKLDIEPAPKVPVPSFVRLFVMRRVLLKHITCSPKDRSTKLMQLVSNAYNNHNDQEKREKIGLAFGILDNLIISPFKKYLSHVFTIKKITPIENVYNEVILRQCGDAFDQVTRYIPHNEDNGSNIMTSKVSVFNTNDLMNLIFQFDNENCNLVSSHWLYYAMNPKNVTS